MPGRPAARWLAGAVLAVLAVECGASEPARKPASGAAAGPDPAPRSAVESSQPLVQRLRVEVVESYPHSPTAFTQGLLVHEGKLYESTGGYGVSALRRVEVASGREELRRDLPPELFAEGLARVGDRLVQLTWREGQARLWDLATFEPAGSWSYEGEGWGLCHDGRRLVRSDGTDVLTLHAVDDFRRLGRLPVRLGGRPLAWLNELECAEGWIYANVWQRDEIVRIDPDSGEVVAVIDASGLLPAAERGPEGVLNGIAYDADTRTFLLTGKNWPRLFRVTFVGG